jgi:large subunit ribosomal protein L30
VAKMLRIKQVKSANGANPAQRDTLRTLGLHGIGTVVERPDRPEFRGMVRTVAHLVKTDEPQADRPVADSTQADRPAADSAAEHVDADQPVAEGAASG